MHLQLLESRGIRKWKKDFSISLLHMGCKVTFWAGRTSSKLFLFPWLTKLYSLTVRLDRLFRQLDSNFLPQGQNLIIAIEEIFQMILTCVNDPITSIDELQNSNLSISFSSYEIKRPEFSLWTVWIFGWQSQNFCEENFGLSILNTSEQKLLKPFFVQL